jgi:hypothetical protein
MRKCRKLACSFAALALVPCAAQAQVLTVVEVGAPAINCVFQTDCNIPVSDTTGNILLRRSRPVPHGCSRVPFAGEAGAPGAGTTGYEYRISMTQAAGMSDCVISFTLNFGAAQAAALQEQPERRRLRGHDRGLGTISLSKAPALRRRDRVHGWASRCASAGPPASRTRHVLPSGSLRPAPPIAHHRADRRDRNDPEILRGRRARPDARGRRLDPPGRIVRTA